MSTRIGVDIGGTFTDLIFFDDAEKHIAIAKVPTTPDSPDKGCADALAQVVGRDKMAEAEFFLHGTTVGLNALIERKGAKVGLLCTRNFRDILEIRRGDRTEMYNLFWQPPEPIVPRHLRLPVTGRILADGSVHVPMEKEDVIEALNVFREEGVTAIAVALMNAYANPAHEILVEETLREAGFEGVVSLSHDVSGEYREYERTSTTVIDAFVQARMANYLERLEQRLKEEGFTGASLITRSGGGAMSFEESRRRSFETIMSGPVAGAEGAAELARKYNFGDVITADVGGTSFDTCIVTNGRPILLYEGNIVGMPLQTPWVDVRSIGSGGGSIAYLDEGGLLRVGPQSAGAVPGPACYGKGGKDPCLTDAAFLLGMLGTGRFESGFSLDRGLAEEAMAPLAEKLGYTQEQTARGVMKIASAFMANAIREITIEQGRDPRTMLLMPFGGAGPLMGTLIADELNIDQILIPPYAGNFSAWGLLGADLVQSGSRTKIMPLTRASIDQANEELKKLFRGLQKRSAKGHASEGMVMEVNCDMRFIGQEHTLNIALPSQDGCITATPDEINASFLEEYRRTFGAVMDELIEFVSLRAVIRRPLPAREEQGVQQGAASAATEDNIEAYSFTEQRKIPFKIINRDSLSVGQKFSGPLIINEATATSYIDAGYDGIVHESGSLLVKHVKKTMEGA